jgi:hypothetical protein
LAAEPLETDLAGAADFAGAAAGFFGSRAVALTQLMTLTTASRAKYRVRRTTKVGTAFSFTEYSLRCDSGRSNHGSVIEHR